MDGFHHIRIGGDVVLDTGYLLRIGKQTFHFLLCAAVAQLEVVEHGVVLLGKALVGVLDGGHIRAHLVGVIGHIRNGHVSVFHSLFRIAAERLDQRCGKARDRFHVLVGGKTCRFVCVSGIPLDLLRGVLEQGVNAADQLFIVRIGSDDFFAQLHGSGSCGNCHSAHCRTYGLQHAAQLAELVLGLFRRIARVLDLFTHIVCRFGGVFQLTLHIVEGGFGVVQLDLPVLGAAVVLSEGVGSVFKSRAQGFNFLLLRFDFLVQHLVPCGESLHGFIVLIELRGGELHFGAEYLEGLVDVCQRLFELLFSLKTDLQSETVCHVPSPPCGWHEKSTLSPRSWDKTVRSSR